MIKAIKAQNISLALHRVSKKIIKIKKIKKIEINPDIIKYFR